MFYFDCLSFIASSVYKLEEGTSKGSFVKREKGLHGNVQVFILKIKICQIHTFLPWLFFSSSHFYFPWKRRDMTFIFPICQFQDMSRFVFMKAILILIQTFLQGQLNSSARVWIWSIGPWFVWCQMVQRQPGSLQIPSKKPGSEANLSNTGCEHWKWGLRQEQTCDLWSDFWD